MALIRRHVRGWAIALTVAGYLALAVVPGSGLLPYLVGEAVARLVLFALVAAFVALLGGRRALAPTTVGLRRALREGRYPVLLALGLCAVEVVGLLQLVAAGEAVPVSPSWAGDLASVALLCVGVGLYEEALFRVLLLGGLLSGRGATRNGVTTAVLVSSVAFGVAHVALVGDPGPLTLVQMLLKTAQTTCIGLVLGAVYVRTRSFVGVAALHALADFVPLSLLAVVGGLEGSLGSYVSGGEGAAAVVAGLALVAVYLVLVALYAPAAVHAWKLLETTPLPACGPFAEGWEARPDDDPALEPSRDDGRPVPPAGL